MREFVEEFGTYDDLKNIPEREVYVADHLASEQIVILHGLEKTGKSYFAEAFSIMCAGGVAWGHLEPARKLRVLYVLTEGKKDDIKERADPPMLDWYEDARERWRWYHIAPVDMKTIHNRAMQRLTEIIVRERPELLVLDSLYSSVEGDLNKNEIIGAFHSALRYLQGRNPGMAIMIVHHDHRQKTDVQNGQVITLDEGKNAIYGSTFIRGMADHIWHFKRSDRGAKVTPVGNRSRYFNPQEFWLEWDEETGTMTPISWSPTDQTMTDLANFCRRSKRFTTASAVNFMNLRAIAERTTQDCLTKLRTHGMIDVVRDSDGKERKGIYVWKGDEQIDTIETLGELDQ